MRKNLQGCLIISTKLLVHILLLAFSLGTLLTVIFDIFHIPSVMDMSILYLCCCLTLLIVFAITIVERIHKPSYLERLLFDVDSTQGRKNSLEVSIYAVSIMNIYLIANTVVVVGFWLVFTEVFNRAEPLAFTLTLLSGFSTFAVRRLKQQLNELDTTV